MNAPRADGRAAVLNLYYVQESQKSPVSCPGIAQLGCRTHQIVSFSRLLISHLLEIEVFIQVKRTVGKQGSVLSLIHI